VILIISTLLAIRSLVGEESFSLAWMSRLLGRLGSPVRVLKASGLVCKLGLLMRFLGSMKPCGNGSNIEIMFLANEELLAIEGLVLYKSLIVWEFFLKCPLF
jgi:hypothetical protein